MILSVIGVAGIFLLGPLRILNYKSAWKTQTIIYQSKHLENKKVEYQLQDKGAFGYNKRIVQVLYLTNYFMVIKEISKGIENDVEWIKLNKEINFKN